MTRNRAFLLAGLVVALLLAGVVSWYASESPDGLERVAGDQGFAQSARDHDLGASPLADYATEGVDDDRLSRSLAGVAGVGATLLIGTAVFRLIRRREPGARGPSGERVATTHPSGERGVATHPSDERA